MSIYNVTGEELQDAYYMNGGPVSQAYDINGNPLIQSIDYDDYILEDYCSVSISQMQGFDIYDGVIFQFRANSTTVNNVMCTIDAENSSIIQNNIPAFSDHGDSASFSDEFYAESDDYPLLYVTADTNPAKVYINRVTTSSSSLVKTLSFPIAQAGYYAALCLDYENQIAYMVGYSEQNYQTDDGGNNKTVISKWDLTNLTLNQDGSYTPAFVSSFQRPFIYVMQGQQFHDGMLWIASGYTGASESYIYAVDPADGTLLHTIDLNTTTEVEGMAFITSNEMVFGLQGGTYKKVVFQAA